MSEERPNNVIQFSGRKRAARMTDGAGAMQSTIAVPIPITKRADEQRLDDAVGAMMFADFRNREKWQVESGGAPAVRIYTREELQESLPGWHMEEVEVSITRLFEQLKIEGANASVKSSGNDAIHDVLKVKIPSRIYYDLKNGSVKETTAPSRTR